MTTRYFSVDIWLAKFGNKFGDWQRLRGIYYAVSHCNDGIICLSVQHPA